MEAFSPDEHGTEICVYDEDGSLAGAWAARKEPTNMTESSSNTSKPTPTKRIEIPSSFTDTTSRGGTVVIVGGVRPPQKNSSPSTGARGVKRPEGTTTGDFRAQD